MQKLLVDINKEGLFLSISLYQSLSYIDSRVTGYVSSASQSGIDDSPTPDKFTDEGGYYKFPNGLVMQWGKIKRDNSIGHINFSIKFPHKLLYVSTQSSAISIHAVANAIYNRTLTGFDYVVDTTSGGGDPNGTGWFAIGY